MNTNTTQICRDGASCSMKWWPYVGSLMTSRNSLVVEEYESPKKVDLLAILLFTPPIFYSVTELDMPFFSELELTWSVLECLELAANPSPRRL